MWFAEYFLIAAVQGTLEIEFNSEWILVDVMR